jgi:chemotaxis protein CheZ
MPVRRKVFRIEEMQLGEQPGPEADAEFPVHHDDMLRELKALRALMERQAAPPPGSQSPAAEVHELRNELQSLHDTIKRTKQEMASLQAAGFNGGQMARVANELGAVVGGAENATQNILTAAEAIDDSANTLSAILQSKHQQGLAQNIQDSVVRIFEACVFHDLVGQRIAKVNAALKFIEDHIVRMIEIWDKVEGAGELAPAMLTAREGMIQLTGGPRLDGDPNSVTQREVDEIFATLRAG